MVSVKLASDSKDVLDDLKRWANLKVGDAIPNEWGPPLTAILKAAIAEIEKLRRKAGAVSDGESFDEIRRLARAGEPLVDIHRTQIRGTADKSSDTE